MKRITLFFCLVLVMLFCTSCFLFKKADNSTNSNNEEQGTNDQITEDVTGTCTHVEVVDEAVAPTCTKTGLTEGKHCSVCNAVIIAQETVSAKGHNEVIDGAVEATCTETGLTEGKHCSICNAVTVAQEVISAKGHSEVIDNAVSATCTEDGLTAGVHCSVCDTVIIAQTVLPATHTWGDWETITASDCFFEGEETRACGACDEIDSRTVDTLSHSFVQNEETKLYACELCDARIYAGHLYAAFDAEVNWYDAYKMCDSLGGHLVTITSDKEQSVVNELRTSISLDLWIGGIYNTNGWNWITGEEFVYTNWLKDQPNNYGGYQWVIKVTTSDNHPVWNDWKGIDKIGYICEWELDIVENEHFFTEWETVTEATCFGDGEKYRFCTHCGLEETETITQLKHNFIFDEAKGVTTCEYCNAAMYDGHIYKIFTVSLSWFDAYTYCQNLGGHLVTITSEEEQTFLNTYMNSQSFSSRAWIGAYSDGAKWQWITDEAFEYMNWASGQPSCDDNKEFFAEINYNKFGKWNDLSPLNIKYFICEWEVVE